MAEGIENRGWYNGPKINMWFNVLTFLPFLSKEINMYAFIEARRRGRAKTRQIQPHWCMDFGVGNKD